MMLFLNIFIELLIGFIALMILTKLLGKTQISQLTPFDFISALVLGELVGNAVYDKNVHIGMILFATILWGVFIYVTEWLTQKFRKTRGIFEGKPSIVIKNGLIDRDQLKKNKLDINQLLNLLRQKDVFSIREVEYAILEADGKISVLKKSNYAKPTISDLNLPVKPVNLAITLISDGEIDRDNLRTAGFDEAWLEQQLRKLNIEKVNDVLYAEWKQDEGFYCQTKMESL